MHKDPLHRLLDRSSTSEEEASDDSALLPITGSSARSVEMSGTSGGEQEPMTNESDADLLKLAAVINRAKSFAEGWEEPYRNEIFRVTVGHLLGHSQTKSIATRSAHTFGGSIPIHRPGGSQVGDSREGGTAFNSVVGIFGPLDKLAKAINTDVDAVERAVHIDDEGKVAVLGRLEGRGKKELQTRYSLVYLYVKEMALGNRMVDVEELRALCVDQGCYDQGNFIGNYKRDVVAGLLREHGEKGARSRRYMLSQKGVGMAADLLREMASQ